MLEKIARYGTVTLIALMVWLYAEGATRKPQTVTFNVNFVPAKDQPLLIEPATQLVTVAIRCATSQLSQVRAEAETPILIEVKDAPGETGRQIDIKDQLVMNDRVNRLGITIERTDPAFIDLRVERIEERRVPIRLVMPTDLELAGPATIEPDTAVVRLPAGQVAQIEGMGLVAALDQNALAGVVPGVPTDRDGIPVTLPSTMAQMHIIDFSPSKVKVTFTVRKKEDEAIISRVPVMLNIAPNLARQYDVAIDQGNLTLPDVKVKGPSDVIARIKSNQVRVEALLRLDPEDLEKLIPSKLPELRLPAGVTSASILPLIKLTIVKRESVPTLP